MAKAQIKIPNGPDIQIEGTSQEIKDLLDFYSANKSSSKKQYSHRKLNRIGNSTKQNSRKNSPTGLIKELIEEGYFKSQKRSLSDIQKKLEERGHIYAQSSLSMPLTRLTRSRELRRIKGKKGWAYVI